MGKKKRQSLSLEALQLVAARFKVLSDPMRLRILQLLQDGEASVTMITASVESTQPNVSKHLKIMQEAGLVARRQDGNTVYYSISDPTVFDLCEVVCSSLQERFSAHASAFAFQPVRTISRRR
ncbi:MAG: metalloregulator ArsR/SmtB family transcription factor [Acidobacteriota bacterium]|nr:metalloregulator ArsR/SmtB family transcription factor [Acidobacteriota bacterium]